MNTVNTKQILSICIPTYNRATLLKKCLNSITRQLKDNRIKNAIEIIVSDNNSDDNTDQTVKDCQKTYENIRYYKNPINIGADINLFMGASRAKGKYIWFFSDDDLHKHNSIKTVLTVIKQYVPDVILVNMDLYSKDLQIALDKNLLRNTKDVYLKTKKDFFSYLETKFFLPFDWHIGVYSNTIVSRKLFMENASKVLIYNGYYNQFAHSALFYYFHDDFKIYIVASSLVKFRSDNRSFGPKDSMSFLRYWYPVLHRHYNIICNINRKNISIKFLFLLELKKITRNLRVMLLRIVSIDIAGILMRLFYKDAQGKRRKQTIFV